MVQRGKLPPPIAAQVYELTDRGRELEPIVLGLGRWGSTAPFPPVHSELGVDALILALKTLYDPSGADGLTGASLELRLGEHRFAARLADGGLDVARGAAGDPVATIITDSATLQQILWHGHSLTTDELSITGDRQAAVRFLTLFPLPSCRPGGAAPGAGRAPAAVGNCERSAASASTSERGTSRSGAGHLPMPPRRTTETYYCFMFTAVCIIWSAVVIVLALAW